MSKHNIRVTVAGPVGSGKSAVLLLIEDALKNMGVGVTFDEKTKADIEFIRATTDVITEIAMYQPTAELCEVIDRTIPQPGA